MGVGCQISGQKHYDGVRFNVISVTRWSNCPKKSVINVTLEWTLTVTITLTVTLTLSQILTLTKTLIIYTIICLKSVCLSGHVRRMQFAILDQSSREMSQTHRIHPRYFLSRVRVSIRPRTFLYAEKPQIIVARIFFT